MKRLYKHMFSILVEKKFVYSMYVILLAHMSHITLSCILSIKIDFSLDTETKYHEDKKRDCIFLQLHGRQLI